MYTRRELAAELVAFLTQRGGGTTVLNPALQPAQGPGRIDHTILRNAVVAQLFQREPFS